MIWQDYITKDLLGSGKSEKAAIIGVSDGSTWASSPDFLKAGEGQGLVDLFKTPENAFASGPMVAGVRYETIKADSDEIYGKKGETGIVALRTNTTIIITYQNESQQLGEGARNAHVLAEKLKENGD